MDFLNPLRGKKKQSLQIAHQFILSASLPLFLAKIQASPSRNFPPGFHGQGRVGVTTHWSPQSSSTGEMLGLVSCFFSPLLPPGSGPGLLPRPSQRERPLRFREENNAGGLGGCLRSRFPRKDGSPGSSCLPPQPPVLDGLNSRALLRKCLSWQQLQPTRTDSSSPALPSSAGWSESWKGVGLGARPERHSSFKVAQCEPRLRSGRLKAEWGKGRGGILSPLGFPPRLCSRTC